MLPGNLVNKVSLYSFILTKHNTIYLNKKVVKSIKSGELEKEKSFYLSFQLFTIMSDKTFIFWFRHLDAVLPVRPRHGDPAPHHRGPPHQEVLGKNKLT